MKKKSFEKNDKDEGFKLLKKIFKYKTKGIVYKLDWSVSSAAESPIIFSTDIKAINNK